MSKKKPPAPPASVTPIRSRVALTEKQKEEIAKADAAILDADRAISEKSAQYFAAETQVRQLFLEKAKRLDSRQALLNEIAISSGVDYTQDPRVVGYLWQFDEKEQAFLRHEVAPVAPPAPAPAAPTTAN